MVGASRRAPHRRVHCLQGGAQAVRYPPVRRQQPPVSERGFDRSCALLLLLPDSLTGCSLSLSLPPPLSGGPLSSARPSSAASSTVSGRGGGTATTTTSSVSGRGKDSCASPWDPLTSAATSRSSKSAAALVRPQQHSSSTAIPHTHPSLPPCCTLQVPRCSCHGHTATVTQIDFSADGAYLMSNCARREQMLWALPNGSRVQNPARLASDAQWLSNTSLLGFDRMGIWGHHNTDNSPVITINSVHSIGGYSSNPAVIANPNTIDNRDRRLGACARASSPSLSSPPPTSLARPLSHTSHPLLSSNKQGRQRQAVIY